MFFLFLFTLLQLQTFETDNSFYVLIQSENEALTFSSYRLNNPERIILEINGSVSTGPIATGQSVKSVKTSEQAGITRFIFETKNNTHYTVLNKSNAVLIGFSSKLFLDDGNFDVTLAKLKESVIPEKKVVIAKKTAPKKEKTLAVKTKKPDESKLIGNLLEDLKKEEIQKKEAESKRLAKLKKQQEIKKALEEKNRLEEEKRIAELKRQEELKKQEIARKKAEEERLAKLQKQEELRRIELEKKEAEKRRLAELKRIEELKQIQLEKKKAEEKRIAELKRQEELKKQEIARKKAEEERLAKLQKQEELRRIELEKKEAEKRRLAELKRIEELRRLELERKKAEEKRLAEIKRIKKEEEEERIAKEKKLAELKLRSKEKEKKKLIKADDGTIRNLKVTKAVGEKSLSEERPELPVKKLVKKGTLKNIYFRKFAEFSRVTLEISGDTEYRFREIKGGYVIDVHNFKKIPRHLLNIIDARAFNAQVKYIYPKKVEDILKIYIKTDKGIAVRKSEEDEIINFDFFEPTLK